jgi:hypothetical protein
LATIKGEKTLADLAQQYDVHANQITAWKAQLAEGAAGVFGAEQSGAEATPVVDLKLLHAKFGELAPAKHVKTCCWTRDLCVSSARPEDRPAEPSVGDGYHLYSDGARLCLPGGRGRLGHSPGAVLALVDHDGSGFLYRGGIGGPGQTRQADIFNTDQGSQFTSTGFTGLLIDNAIAISMDGRGAWRDNVFVERLWRSVKYEEV